MATNQSHTHTHTPGLWNHISLPTTFTLAVDDFRVKYFPRNDTLHLITALKTNYTITIVDWTGSKYCGSTIDWNCYANYYVNISMPGYVTKTLHRFNHKTPTRPQHSPHPWTTPTYGAKVQFAPTPSTPPLVIDKKEKTRVQAITGTFLYYSWAVDPTMLVALNEITAQQAAPTAETVTKTKMLLDYTTTNPEATIR
jgi:hypothetical protein